MKQQLLSVIVPCYNVEKYLDKCIQSIVGQTYSHLEILLIDDGSTDNTGTVCDAWQAKDSRIRVIHQQNEGSSYARKTGVENATAEYVTFADADDWIDKNMYADMMTAMLTTNSDIADCDLCYVYPDGRTEYRSHEQPATIETFGRVDGTLMMLQTHKWRSSLGTKIFKKRLFKHIQFPKGRKYGEDMVIPFLYHQASQTVLMNSPYYYYYQRSDSVCTKGSLQKELIKLRDFSDANYELYAFAAQHSEYHSVATYLKIKASSLGIVALRNMIAYPEYFTKACFKNKVEQMRTIFFTEDETIPAGVHRDLKLLKMSVQLYYFWRWLLHRAFLVTNRLKITDKPGCLSIEDYFYFYPFMIEK